MAGESKHSDYGRLARRVAGWTTNGLATALVLVAGLTLGRQVLIWWREAPAESALPSQAADVAARQLEFESLATTVQSRTIRGTRADLLQALRDLCRPAQRPQVLQDPSPSDAERRLLAELAAKEPVEVGDGWRIDELPQQLPLVICSTWAGPQRSESSAPLDLRIVSIGLAVPGKEDRWTAYAFRLGDHGVEAEGVTFPTPAHSRHVMTLRQSDGSVLIAFRGIVEPARWQVHFLSEPAEQGWELVRQSGLERRGWQAEFVKDGPQKLKATVHFEYDGQGRLSGLVHVQPEAKP